MDDGWVDRWVDGWMDGQVDGWLGQKERGMEMRSRTARDTCKPRQGRGGARTVH